MTLNLTAIGKPIGPITRDYSWRDVVLYALGVGAGFDDLDYCYEKGLKVLPSFSAAAVFEMFFLMGAEANVNPAGILHGEQKLVFHHPMPTEGTLTTTGRIVNIYDKGPNIGAVVVGESETWHGNGKKLFDATFVLFSRLDGGFGGPDAPPAAWRHPDRPPDFEIIDTPRPDQPLIYRLSGDTFQLHVDHAFARAAGFDGPIMHGMCTHGFACRALVNSLIPGAPERLERFDCRFSRPLYPGVPIKTQIWKTGGGSALWRVLNAKSGEVVIDNGVAAFSVPAEKTHIRFDGRVAIVTGAGGGLGRAYALELARRGARVVVNDFGGSRDGEGPASSAPAQQVVREIQEQGGEAVPSFDSVVSPEGGRRIVQTALDAFGSVDILINNAGILRDKSFAKLTPENWQAVIDVHLNGAYNVTQPAFGVMKQNGYGRIVLTGSAAGLYGNFGQTNYAAAKMGLVGLMNALKLEGEKYHIRINTVAPLAASRLTEDVMPPEIFDQAKPEYVVPMVLYLCSETCSESGCIFNAGLGHFSRAAIVTGAGALVGDGQTPPTPEAIADAMESIGSIRGAKEYRQLGEQLMDVLEVKTRSEGPRTPAGADRGSPLSVSEIFKQMPHVFNPDAAVGITAVFQFRIAGSDGGDWYCQIADRTCTVRPGIHDRPSCTLLLQDGDFIKLMAGELDAIEALSTGRLKVSGDLAKGQLIGSLFRW